MRVSGAPPAYDGAPDAVHQGKHPVPRGPRAASTAWLTPGPRRGHARTPSAPDRLRGHDAVTDVELGRLVEGRRH